MKSYRGEVPAKSKVMVYCFFFFDFGLSETLSLLQQYIYTDRSFSKTIAFCFWQIKYLHKLIYSWKNIYGHALKFTTQNSIFWINHLTFFKTLYFCRAFSGLSVLFHYNWCALLQYGLKSRAIIEYRSRPVDRIRHITVSMWLIQKKKKSIVFKFVETRIPINSHFRFDWWNKEKGKKKCTHLQLSR